MTFGIILINYLILTKSMGMIRVVRNTRSPVTSITTWSSHSLESSKVTESIILVNANFAEMEDSIIF